jgi:hypothetical protein
LLPGNEARAGERGPSGGKVLKLDNMYKFVTEDPKVKFLVPEKNSFIQKCQPLIIRTLSPYKPKGLTEGVMLLRVSAGTGDTRHLEIIAICLSYSR